MKHSDNIKYYDDLDALAEQLGDLYYDTLADFLNNLSNKIMRDGCADMRRERPKLSGYLMECSRHLEQASAEIQQAWEICKPYVKDNNKRKEMKHNNNNRSARRDTAKETLGIIDAGYYTCADEQINIQDKVEICVKNTRLYTPSDLAKLKNAPSAESSCKIEIVNETTLQGAKRLFDTGSFKRIAVLNFASAKNAGGGFLGGSQAQEESLVRSSALYDSLQQCPDFYHYHRRKNKSLLYSDHMIYSPKCPVFRDDNGDLLEQTYSVDFITAAAPNRGATARNQPEVLTNIDRVFTQRISFLLRLAVHNNCDALVLGAWGCGVFANVPEKVASYFEKALRGDEKLSQYFKQISFSIPDRTRERINTKAFIDAFEEKQ